VARRLRGCLAAAGLFAAVARAEGPAVPSPPAQPLEVRSAGQVTFEPERSRWTLTGGAVLRRGPLSLRADRATWDAGRGELHAEGGILLAEPGRLLSAESLALLPGGAFDATGVRGFWKERAEDLSGCASGEEARTQGRNRLSFFGDRISGRRGEERLLLQGARLTLCDCPAGAPSWELRARRADIVPGDRVVLDWPVLWVTPRFLGIERPVPVLAFPWGYVPLADRQTGLLLPELRHDRNGYGVALPFFLTLGRSWDATVTPEWITGPSASTVAEQHRGVRGPGLGLELRWAPVEGAAGLVRLHAVHSTLSAWPDGAWRPPGGERLELAFRHRQPLGAEAGLAVDGWLAGDPYVQADFTGDLLARNAEYRRSAAAAWWRAPDVLLAADLHASQPLAGLEAAPGGARAPFGWFGGDLSTFHRLPALTAQLLPVALAGPARLAGRLSLVRFGPLRGASGDEGPDGIGPGDRPWGFTAGSTGSLARDAGERDGRWQPGERLATSRALARLELTAPLAAGRWLAAEPWIAATGAGYLFDAARGALATGRVAAGLALSTQLARRGGEGSGRWLHAVTPRLELRAGSASHGGPLPSGYASDDDDVAPAPVAALAPSAFPLRLPARSLSAAPVGGWRQLRASVRSRLAWGSGNGIDLEVGQDVDLGRRQGAEAFAALEARAGAVRADLSARFDPFGAGAPRGSPAPVGRSWLDRFPELRAEVAVGDRRGEVHAGFLAYGAGGSRRLAAGADPLFDDRPLALEATAFGTAGVRVRWSAATFWYDLQFNARRLADPVVAGGRLAPHVYQQTAGAVWDSPCRCFKLGVVASLREGDATPSWHLTFDVAGAGLR